MTGLPSQKQSVSMSKPSSENALLSFDNYQQLDIHSMDESEF